MIAKLGDLAVFGNPPTFSTQLDVGQYNLPPWESIERAFQGIFERRYYTNHGPLVRQLEAELAILLGVKHVVCMTNATIGLVIAAKALGIQGRVVTSAFSSPEAAQSIEWAGLEVHFCDIDPFVYELSLKELELTIKQGVGGVLANSLWPMQSRMSEIEELCRSYGVPLYFDFQHVFGKGVGHFGKCSVFSFHSQHILNATEGGCVCTSDDQLAARIRNIRSSYGSGPVVDIPLTGNGRMSEAQAAMALLALQSYGQIRARNEEHLSRYRLLLKAVRGLRIDDCFPGSESVVVHVTEKEFGLSRDELVKILKAENINAATSFAPGLQRTDYHRKKRPEFVELLPVTDSVCSGILQLPSGQALDSEKIARICEVIRFAQANAQAIKNVLS